MGKCEGGARVVGRGMSGDSLGCASVLAVRRRVWGA